MLLDVAVLAIVVSLLLGGRLRNLAEVDVRGLTWAVLVVVLQFGSRYLVDLGWTWLAPWAPAIYAGSFLLLLVFIWKNRRHPAIVLLGVGILLNGLVIAANGGKMPVSAERLAEAGLEHFIEPLHSGLLTHQPITGETRLAFLADIYVLKPPYPLPKVISIGDMLLAAGAVWFVVGGMLAHPSVTGKKRVIEVRRLTRIP